MLCSTALCFHALGQALDVVGTRAVPYCCNRFLIKACHHCHCHMCFPSNSCIIHNCSGIASDGLKGRVFEVSLADLQNDEVAFRKFKLITEDVQGKNCLTNFHGMDLTRDKMCSMVKKWQVTDMFRSSCFSQQ